MIALIGHQEHRRYAERMHREEVAVHGHDHVRPPDGITAPHPPISAEQFAATFIHDADEF